MPARQVKGLYVTTDLGRRVVASAGCTDKNRWLAGEKYARLQQVTVNSWETNDALELQGDVQGTRVVVKLPQPHSFYTSLARETFDCSTQAQGN